MNVTVFGGSGFLGKILVRALLQSGARVCVMSRFPERVNAIKPAGPVGQLLTMSGDILCEADVLRAVRGADAVVNLVGVLHESGTQRFASVHAQAAERIAKISKQCGVKRLVHISALGVDGHSTARYARTKATGEKAVLSAFPDATILRPSIMFGPGDGFFARFARIMRCSYFVPLIGGGHSKFQPVYAGDVAAAIQAALMQEGCKRNVYELGGPQIKTFRELLMYLQEMLGLKRCFVTIPFSVASMMASLLESFPRPFLTRDQVRLLRSDNIVSPGALSFSALGITPVSYERVVPKYV